MPKAAAAAPPRISALDRKVSWLRVCTTLITTKKREMLSTISMNWRRLLEVGRACWRPIAKVKAAITMNSATAPPMEDVLNLVSSPSTYFSTHTPNVAKMARSRKLGVKPILKGSVAKGNRVLMAIMPTSPHMTSCSTNTPAMRTIARANATRGPATPITRPMTRPLASNKARIAQRCRWGSGSTRRD